MRVPKGTISPQTGASKQNGSTPQCPQSTGLTSNWQWRQRQHDQGRRPCPQQGAEQQFERLDMGLGPLDAKQSVAMSKLGPCLQPSFVQGRLINIGTSSKLRICHWLEVKRSRRTSDPFQSPHHHEAKCGPRASSLSMGS
eukprot:1159189-Pelagomonas_calceolata.AAC.7